MQRVILPRATKQEPKVLEMPQFEKLLSGVGETAWLSLLLELAAATGCRRGELLALQWSDVDFTTVSIHVRCSLGQTKKKGLFLKPPKGRKDRRFKLPASALTALAQHRTEQEKMKLLFGPDYRTDLDLIFAM
jgi:integrase